MDERSITEQNQDLPNSQNLKKKKKSTIIHEGSDKPNAPRTQHYVDNAAFYQALVERRPLVEQAKKDGLPKPKISNFIGECILKIATNLAKKFNFSLPKYAPYKEEMIGDGVENCIRYVDSFDPTITKNPFSYFTQTCYYAFIRRIEIEDEAIASKYKYTLESAVMQELADYSSVDDAENPQLDVSLQNMEEYVKHYDEKMSARKESSRKKKEEKLKGLELLIEKEDE